MLCSTYSVLRHRASQQPNFSPLCCATSATGNSIYCPCFIYSIFQLFHLLNFFSPLCCATSAAGNSINSPCSISVTISFQVLCDLSIKSDEQVCSNKMVYFNALNLVSPRYSPYIRKISKEYI